LIYLVLGIKNIQNKLNNRYITKKTKTKKTRNIFCSECVWSISSGEESDN